ncbi:MAG: N-formylglutamate amidohydrolase [Nitriliruptoraceae bacterium]
MGDAVFGPRSHVEVVAPNASAVPVLVHVPHAGTELPNPVREAMLLDDAALATELRLLTDHRTDLLAAGTGRAGATRVVNRISRLVVDPERFPDEREELAAQGMGAVYTRGHALQPLRTPSPGDVELLLTRYFHPYAATVTEVVDELLAAHGRLTILDLHSYPSVRLPYELHDGPRPELCIGTDPFHTPEWLRSLVVGVAAAHGLHADLDTPFAGAYVPERHHGQDRRVTSVMLELRRDLYLDEASATPHDGEARIAGFVTAVVSAIGSAHRHQHREHA